MRSVRVLMLLAAPAAGCFYVDPINERPTADIERVNPTLPRRGERVTVWAQIYDPDGDDTTVAWTAIACSGPQPGDCDPAPYASAATYAFEVTTPTLRADAVTPAVRMRVELDVVDAWGARTAILQTLDVNLENARPWIEPQRQGHQFRGYHPVGVPVTIVAAFGDDDDARDTLDVTAQLFAPTGATLEDAILSDLPDGAGGERRWRLVANVPGQWDVRVRVRDPVEPPGEDTETISVPVAADHPPCLGAAEPAFPPAGARIVLDEPRRFAALSVDDDLDVYPPPPEGHPVLGAARFRWWLASPDTGGALAPLGVAGNAVELDPAWYAPGDELALRVEAVDGADRPLCDGAMPSCELVPGCFQRRTWTVEVR